MSSEQEAAVANQEEWEEQIVGGPISIPKQKNPKKFHSQNHNGKKVAEKPRTQHNNQSNTNSYRSNKSDQRNNKITHESTTKKLTENGIESKPKHAYAGKNNQHDHQKHRNDKFRTKENKERAKRNDYKKKKSNTIGPKDFTEQEIFNSGIRSGINFEKYNEIEVKLTGENAPQPIDEFTSGDVSLSAIIKENIEKAGYKQPTPIQKYAIPSILLGRDLMGCAQTGSGKTGAYLIPIIDYLLKKNVEMTIGSPRVILLSPTRELAIQIFKEVLKFSWNSDLKSCLLYGGYNNEAELAEYNNGCHILVVTPGLLVQLLEKEKVKCDLVNFIVLDEADRMLDMGFLPNIQKFMENKTMAKEKNVVMFSATFRNELQELASKFLMSNYLFLSVGIVGSACSDVHQEIIEVTTFKKRSVLKDILQDKRYNDRVLVFVETKRGADFLASLLSETTIPTTSIHGDRVQEEREKALKDFKTGKMKVLVATNIAARGLDIKNVQLVINYDLPKSIDEYVHRIGRTGRLGNQGKAISFYDKDEDKELVNDLIKILIQSKQEIPQFLRAAQSGNLNGSLGDTTDIREQGAVENNSSDDIKNETVEQD